MPTLPGPTVISVAPAAGTPVVYSKTFAFNTANLSNGTGAVVYTPAVGDLLLDAWVQLDTAWDGTTPKLDIGTGTGGGNPNQGLFSASSGSPLAPTVVDENGSSSGAGYLFSASLLSLATYGTLNNTRGAPGLFTASNPLKIWVTQDGLKNGAAPGASQGAAIVYIVIARAVAL